MKRAQALGFSLDEIRRILSLRGSGRATCGCVIAMSEATLAETEQKLHELQTFAGTLKQNLERWRKMSGKGSRVAGDFCELIESSAASGTPGAKSSGSGNKTLRIRYVTPWRIAALHL